MNFLTLERTARKTVVSHGSEIVGYIFTTPNGYDVSSTIEGVTLNDKFPQFLDAVQWVAERVLPSVSPPSGHTGGSGDNCPSINQGGSQ